MKRTSWISLLALLSLALSAGPLPARANATASAPGTHAAPPPADWSAELHAHLFMKEGMSWMFTGDFFGPLRARDWSDRFRSQANPESLEQSGAGLVVATLYAHPLMTLSLRDAVRRQADLAERFVREHPNWILARSADEARAGLAAGHKVMVLALEGVSGIIENDADLAEFIDRRGIRIVTILHLTDDWAGGVAFLRGWMSLSNPPGWVRRIWAARDDEHGVRINDHGLTDGGRELARKLIARGVWIDLAHASDRAADELIPMMKQAGQPLLYTHTVLRRYHGAERGISDAQLAQVKATGGVVGVMPAEEMLDGTPRPPGAACDGGAPALATQYRELVAALGAESVSLGSDYNGGVRHLRPGCATGTSLDGKGLWNMAQVPDVWRALRGFGAPVPEHLKVTIDRFLDAWARVTAVPGAGRADANGSR
jgi:microsomal dipeptidase-like Zn-dependent dipeptidase